MVLSRITINSLIEREYMAAAERFLFTLNKGNYLVLSEKRMIHLQKRNRLVLFRLYREMSYQEISRSCWPSAKFLQVSRYPLVISRKTGNYR